MVYMFNELSLQEVNSISDARTVLEKFVKSIIFGGELGLTEMRLYEGVIPNLYNIQLFDSYRIDNWLSDKEINSDLQLRFREIFTTYPLITDEEIIDLELYTRSSFTKKVNSSDIQVWGLGAAYVFDTLSISLATHVDWSSSTVLINHYSLLRDGNDNFEDVVVKHFSDTETLKEHTKWIEKHQIENLKRSEDLWNEREALFSDLLFGKEVEHQFKSIGLSKKFFRIIDILKKLNEFAKSWNTDGFNLNTLKEDTKLDISGESICTMQKYSSLRRFQLYTGEKVQFELHIKLPDIRIYFLPDETNHKIHIGYIGKHIRTCLFD